MEAKLRECLHRKIIKLNECLYIFTENIRTKCCNLKININTQSTHCKNDLINN